MENVTKGLRELAEGEFAALVTVEAAERLAVRAFEAIGADDLVGAQRLLLALIDETSARSATAVKDQQRSDAIAQRARSTVERAHANAPVLPAVVRDSLRPS